MTQTELNIGTSSVYIVIFTDMIHASDSSKVKLNANFLVHDS